MSKLPATRIGRSRETQTKELDQAGSKLGSTFFFLDQQEILHPDRKPSENQGQRRREKLYNEEAVVRGWKSRRNMLSIIHYEMKM